MKRFSTFILRCAALAAGIAVVAICSVMQWQAMTEWNFDSVYGDLMYTLLSGLYMCAVPFFIALYQTMKLLGYIDADCVFSDLSVKALKNITYCASVVFVICTVGGLPFFYKLAQLDDAPGLVIVGMVIAGSAFVIAVFASILRRIFQEGIDLKQKNDLTVSNDITVSNL